MKIQSLQLNYTFMAYEDNIYTTDLQTPPKQNTAN